MMDGLIQALGLPTESRPIVKHVLSKEQQLYYEKMTDAIKGCVQVGVLIAVSRGGWMRLCL